MDDAKTIDDIVIEYKANVAGKSVSPEEIRLVQAHLGDLLKRVLMDAEEE